MKQQRFPVEDWRAAMLRSGLSPAARLLLLVASENITAQGDIPFPLDQLAERLDWSPSNIRGHRDAARKAGWLSPEQSKALAGKGTGEAGRPAHYRATWPRRDTRREHRNPGALRRDGVSGTGTVRTVPVGRAPSANPGSGANRATGSVGLAPCPVDNPPQDRGKPGDGVSGTGTVLESGQTKTTTGRPVPDHHQTAAPELAGGTAEGGRPAGRTRQDVRTQQPTRQPRSGSPGCGPEHADEQEQEPRSLITCDAQHRRAQRADTAPEHDETDPPNSTAPSQPRAVRPTRQEPHSGSPAGSSEQPRETTTEPVVQPSTHPRAMPPAADHHTTDPTATAAPNRHPPPYRGPDATTDRAREPAARRRAARPTRGGPDAP